MYVYYVRLEGGGGGGGGGGALLRNVLYGETPLRGPTPHPFIYHFRQKRHPFVYLLLTNTLVFLTVVNAL